MSLLLHPLDFLGRDDESDLAFFPGMAMPPREKFQLARDVVRMLAARYRVVCMRRHARLAARKLGLPKEVPYPSSCSS